MIPLSTRLQQPPSCQPRGYATASTSTTAAPTAAAGSSSSSGTRVFMWGQGTEGQLGHWPFEKNALTGGYVELSPREVRRGPFQP